MLLKQGRESVLKETQRGALGVFLSPVGTWRLPVAVAGLLETHRELLLGREVLRAREGPPVPSQVWG